nr:LAGLIDADG endonuclease [Orbilia dorsalia]QBF58411.1 LAGLIDADG endonuclease [Orbilia dorsalia]
MVGLILSDAWIKFSSKTSKNALLGFSQSNVNSKYFWFVFFSLSHYCSSYPLKVKDRLGTNTIELQFETRSMTCITELYLLFYSEKIKVIPQNIYNLLTPIALAHLIMGDGSWQRHGLIVCTDSYKLVDVVRLMNVLIIRYRLGCTIRVNNKNKYRIYINQSSMALLVDAISPYMHYSMVYKLNSWLNTPRDRNEIEVFDVENNITTTYCSISEAAKKLNIPKSAIVNYFSRNQNKPYKGKYRFNKI